jgi:hypothetical protein
MIRSELPSILRALRGVKGRARVSKRWPVREPVFLGDGRWEPPVSNRGPNLLPLLMAAYRASPLVSARAHRCIPFVRLAHSLIGSDSRMTTMRFPGQIRRFPICSGFWDGSDAENGPAEDNWLYS